MNRSVSHECCVHLLTLHRWEPFAVARAWGMAVFLLCALLQVTEAMCSGPIWRFERQKGQAVTGREAQALVRAC